jgi:hypothetical protein
MEPLFVEHEQRSHRGPIPHRNAGCPSSAEISKCTSAASVHYPVHTFVPGIINTREVVRRSRKDVAEVLMQARRWLVDRTLFERITDKPTRPGSCTFDTPTLDTLIMGGLYEMADLRKCRGATEAWGTPEPTKIPPRDRVINETVTINALTTGTANLPTIPNIIELLAHPSATYHHSFDFKSWFHQFELDESVRDWFQSTARDGRTIRLKRLAMGQRQSVDVAQNFALAIAQLALDSFEVDVAAVIYVDNIIFLGDRGDVNLVATKFKEICVEVNATIGDETEGQSGCFVGLQFDLFSKVYGLSDKTIEKFDRIKSAAYGSMFTTPRQVMCVGGILTYAQYVLGSPFEYSKGYMFWLLHEAVAFRVSHEPAFLDREILLRNDVKMAMKSLLDCCDARLRVNMIRAPPDLLMAIDASARGWAAILLPIGTTTIHVFTGNFAEELKSSVSSEAQTLVELCKQDEARTLLRSSKSVIIGTDHTGLLKSTAWRYSYVGTYNAAILAFTRITNARLVGRYIAGVSNPCDEPSRRNAIDKGKVEKWIETSGYGTGIFSYRYVPNPPPG